MSAKEVSILFTALIAIELIVAIVASHGLNSKFFSEEKDFGKAMRQFSSEKPVAAFLTKACYTLMIFELVIAMVIKFIGIK